MWLFYLFEIVSLLYSLGALIVIFYLVKKYRGETLKGIVWPGILLLGILFLFKIQAETYQIDIREQKIETGKLPGTLTVALVSDTHFRPLKNEWLLKKVAEKMKTINPDIIIFAGDFLFLDQADKYVNDFQNFKKVSALAPALAVLGNHDYGIGDSSHRYTYTDQHEKIKKLLENAGVRVLVDENTFFDFQGQKIQLVGFDEFWRWEKDPAKAVRGLINEGLKIGLSHNPDAAYLPESKNLDILLSGHTHGGQIRLPLIGSLAKAETSFPRAVYGRLVNDLQPKIFNTVGLGESGFPIRFFDHPEISVLKIK